jgi:tetratricopeptide (TPR) repeat protein
MNPENIDALNYLGVALVKKGRIQEGVLQFEKALHINPYNKNAQRNLQFALEKMKKSKNTVITP